LLDATRAFHHLASNFHFSCFADEAVIASIMKTVESKKIPITLKVTIVNTFLVILKNINFKKYFLGLQPVGIIMQIIELAMEGAQSKHGKDDPNNELYLSSLRVVISMMCLPQVTPQ
jgi:hypothetical protein